MMCTKFQVFTSKTVTSSSWPYGYYRGFKRQNLGESLIHRSVLVSKQYWLVTCNGLYRVKASWNVQTRIWWKLLEKYRFPLQNFGRHETHRGPKRGKPGRNRNTSPCSVLVSTGCETTLGPPPQPELQKSQEIYTYSVKISLIADSCAKFHEPGLIFNPWKRLSWNLKIWQKCSFF